MATIMLAPGQLAIQQVGKHRGHHFFPVVVAKAQIFGTQKLKNGSGGNGCLI